MKVLLALLLSTSCAVADTLFAVSVDGGQFIAYNTLTVNLHTSQGPWQFSAAVEGTGSASQVWAIDNSPGASTIEVIVTERNLTTPYTGLGTIQFFPISMGAGWSTTMTVRVDQSNGLFGGTLIDSDTFTAALPTPGQIEVYNITLTAPYSITTEFDIHTSGISFVTSNNYVNVGPTAAPVPGPVVGAGLPGLLIALLGGWWLWRRRCR